MTKVDEAVLQQLEILNGQIRALLERVDKQTTDLQEFSERFEEVMDRVEQERRLDLYGVDD